LVNSILLINHEIDSAYWNEWKLFKMKGGITGADCSNSIFDCRLSGDKQSNFRRRIIMNIKKVIQLAVITIACFLFISNHLFALTATEIIKKSERAIRGNTQIGIYEIVIKTRRWTRTMKMKSYESRRQKRSFTEIYAPKKDAGNRFLLINKNMWHYVPKLQQTVKISPSMMLESWMGSDFTNDDIVKESSIVNDYTHSTIGKETISGHKCYKIKLMPKPDSAVVWGKILYFARENDYLPVREEYYNEHNILKKVMTCSNFKKMHDRIIPTLYKMRTIKKKNRYTLMKIKRIKFNAGIPGRIFSLQNLKRR
ncbi:MAG: outer membrane lipoprotein-sorting protein, partial [Candidatus Omnitrophica bacterium]|nr:outer membrane lipoprotein-sorting protein [Candidatus Omnitrophota bacterium]